MDACGRLVVGTHYLYAKSLHRRFYDVDGMKSLAARRDWIEPNLPIESID
jgi:hypothetical protein